MNGDNELRNFHNRTNRLARCHDALNVNFNKERTRSMGCNISVNYSVILRIEQTTLLDDEHQKNPGDCSER